MEEVATFLKDLLSKIYNDTRPAKPFVVNFSLCWCICASRVNVNPVGEPLSMNRWYCRGSCRGDNVAISDSYLAAICGRVALVLDVSAHGH